MSDTFFRRRGNVVCCAGRHPGTQAAGEWFPQTNRKPAQPSSDRRTQEKTSHRGSSRAGRTSICRAASCQRGSCRAGSCQRGSCRADSCQRGSCGAGSCTRVKPPSGKSVGNPGSSRHCVTTATVANSCQINFARSKDRRGKVLAKVEFTAA
jgi:hypothetical protein